jgi:hypothetical protein
MVSKGVRAGATLDVVDQAAHLESTAANPRITPASARLVLFRETQPCGCFRGASSRIGSLWPRLPFAL